VVTGDGGPEYRFVLRFSDAQRVHSMLPSTLQAPPFPAWTLDSARDMVRDSANVARRGSELREYYEQLLRLVPVRLVMPALCEALASQSLDVEFGALVQQYGTLAPKLRKDPGLLERAMAYLRVTGEVLCHQTDLHHVEQRERVFLRPQWLVDVMKALVHHDLGSRLDKVLANPDPDVDGAMVTTLGQQFMLTGELDRRLLPWIWCELEPPVGRDTDKINFLVSLLVKLGLLAELPDSAGQHQRWLLPMRLPDRLIVLHAQGSFAAVTRELDSDSPVMSLDATLQQLPTDVAGLSASRLEAGLVTARQKVEELDRELGPDPCV
jgi:hypothetical protein